MKNKLRLSVLILFICVLLISISLTTHEAIGKPAYCYNALLDCANKCEAVYDGWFEFAMRGGCKTGCGIGYIFC